MVEKTSLGVKTTYENVVFVLKDVIQARANVVQSSD